MISVFFVRKNAVRRSDATVRTANTSLSALPKCRAVFFRKRACANLYKNIIYMYKNQSRGQQSECTVIARCRQKIKKSVDKIELMW